MPSRWGHIGDRQCARIREDRWPQHGKLAARNAVAVQPSWNKPAVCSEEKWTSLVFVLAAYRMPVVNRRLMEKLMLRNVAWVGTIASILLIVGCATERAVAPTISAEPRSGLSVSPPILAAVYDGRTTGQRKDAAITLQADLARLYGSSIEWSDYFAKTPAGRVSVRFRIVALGASFGSRLVSSAAYATAAGSAQETAIGPWGPVVTSVLSQQSGLAGSISAEGWWNGAAWVDIEVEDLRGLRPVVFTLPIAAEHRESNMWGYGSGDKAARAAWDKVGAQLTRAMDAILRALRD